MKDFYRLITTRLLLLVAFFMASTGLQAQPENILVNGDFSSSYSGWTPSAYVYYYYGVSNFDIDGPGPKASSPAFWGRAGSGSYIVNLSQTVSLTAGRTYVVSADIASIIQNASYNMVLTYAGIFELSIGGTIVASHDFGPSIQRDNPLYGSLSGTYVAPSTGDFVLNIKIYKPQYTANTYHYMYVDNVILNWQAPQVNLAVTTDPSGAGTVDKTPEKVTYNQGETVQLTANPEFGYMFSNWSGDVASSNNPLDLLMDDHKTVTAHFDPANVLVKFLNSSDVGISGGVVEYYDRGWQNAGITDEKGELRFNYDGRRSRLNFRLTYNGEIMTQNNVSFMEGPVIFQLEGTTVLLLSSTGDGLPGGLAEVFNGSWTELGTTDENGEVKAGLPSGYYSIRMTYEGMTETKSNLDISSPVIFQTLNMVVRLEHAMVGGIPDGEVMFQAPAKAWSAFGITDNSGNTSKELLPGVYDFNMTYQSSTEEMNGVDISVTNPLVFEPAPGSEISYITESKIANPDGVTNHFAWELASAGISDEFAIVGAEWDKG
ncbi:MAG: hypothetical protein GX158_09920, partial [Bacteroidales bacterium]|nr:hypothetical protein [Bacteroidales bacterium]